MSPPTTDYLLSQFHLKSLAMASPLVAPCSEDDKLGLLPLPAGPELIWIDGEALDPTSDKFRMYHFKISPCHKQAKHPWEHCLFAHEHENARRRNPKEVKYVSEPCPDYKAAGVCISGKDCPFSHGVYERNLHPCKYRTQMCVEGPACKRSVCFFAHDQSQLRAPENALSTEEAEAIREANICRIVNEAPLDTLQEQANAFVWNRSLSAQVMKAPAFYALCVHSHALQLRHAGFPVTFANYETQILRTQARLKDYVLQERAGQQYGIAPPGSRAQLLLMALELALRSKVAEEKAALDLQRQLSRRAALAALAEGNLGNGLGLLPLGFPGPGLTDPSLRAASLPLPGQGQGLLQNPYLPAPPPQGPAHLLPQSQALVAGLAAMQPPQAVPGAAFEGRMAMKVKRCVGIAPLKDTSANGSPQNSRGAGPLGAAALRSASGLLPTPTSAALLQAAASAAPAFMPATAPVPVFQSSADEATTSAGASYAALASILFGRDGVFPQGQV